MAVDNKTLQNFFNKQKKPRIDALISLNTPKKIVNAIKNASELSPKTIDSKVISNQYQSGIETDIKIPPNQYQTDIAPTPNQYQSNNKTDIETNTKLVPNKHQADTQTGFFSLTGLQKEITITIYKLCQISRAKKTDAVSIAQLSSQCQSTVGAVKIAVHRLIDKGILLRESFKNGRGGWTVYSITNSTHQEIFNLEAQSKLVSNQYQNSTKLVTKLISEVIPNHSSSSGINHYVNTTTTGELKNPKSSDLSDEWLKIDIEPLSNIGFTKTHLTQIASQNILPSELVQNSIYAFDFDLRENNKVKSIKGDPINFFMGILRNGKPYTPPSNYESPQDKAMRIYLENMRAAEQRRVDMEKEAITLAFNSWFSRLSNEQKIEFLPEMLRRNANGEKLERSKILESSAKNHFEKEVWPVLRENITSNKNGKIQ